MRRSQKSKQEVSVVLVSYNTKDITDNCLASLKKQDQDSSLQIIVSDNGSTDGSVEVIRSKYPDVELIENKANLGFSKGNNKARKYIKSENVLFLNTDTIVDKKSIKEPLQYIKEHAEIGAITCRVILPNGKDDPDTIRSFPFPLIAAKHFLGLESEFRYPNLDRSKQHEVDVIQGAFLLTRKSILDEVGWFDEDYFLDGEDIDLCWRIKKAGFKLVYYPKSKITHIKKASKSADRKKSLQSVLRGVEAMELFYKKRLSQQYTFLTNWLVLGGIQLLKLTRIFKYYLHI